jgi:hypothetical protein
MGYAFGEAVPEGRRKIAAFRSPLSRHPREMAASPQVSKETWQTRPTMESAKDLPSPTPMAARGHCRLCGRNNK